MVEVVTTEDRGKCIRPFARIVRKNAKFHLNPEKIDRSIARIVFQSIKMADVNFTKVSQAIQKPVRLIPAGLLLILFFTVSLCFAQGETSSSDTIAKMQADLNLTQKQVYHITPIIERYAVEFADLQKSIDDNTINPSAIDSQRQQLQASEDQEISPYLTANQINQWSYIRNHMNTQQKDAGSDNNPDSDIYSNLPRDVSTQN